MAAGNDNPFRPTKGDRRAQIRGIRAADAEQSAAAKQQMRAEGFDPETGLPTNPVRNRDLRTGPPGRVLVGATKAAGSSAGGTVAGLFLGGFFYFLGVATLRGGPAGARAWLGAKFLNKVA